MAISDVILEGGLTFKTNLDKGGGKLKSEDFWREVIYGLPLCLKLTIKTPVRRQ